LDAILKGPAKNDTSQVGFDHFDANFFDNGQQRQAGHQLALR
jgi:hypothetical protein